MAKIKISNTAVEVGTHMDPEDQTLDRADWSGLERTINTHVCKYKNHEKYTNLKYCSNVELVIFICSMFYNTL